ncbi:MAG: transcription elongation factor GreB [Halobacteriovoraceae bacterium]|nr:transcription elongation factor GreB [Halobacteriovoraceae bacterium]MBT5095781.1 transcription elongation factor GreB [Halobacteriovoraceae bacterium]
MDKKKNYITPGGFKRLQDEAEHLSKVERPEVVKTVAWAASLGDRSENADYQYGKKRLREIDRRLNFLSRQLNKAIQVDPLNLSGELVKFGATVTVEDADGEGRIYSIVGADEINTEQGYISWFSPIGSALFGKTIDDEVTVKIPSGTLELTIVAVHFKSISIPPFVATESLEMKKH